jgi:hypothetical protein
VRLRVETDPPQGGRVVARVVLDNDAGAPIVFDRRLLIGPNLSGPRGPFPESAEPGFEAAAQNEVVLGAGCFYGRERSWDGLPPGDYELGAELRAAAPGGAAVAADPVRLRLPG